MYIYVSAFHLKCGVCVFLITIWGHAKHEIKTFSVIQIEVPTILKLEKR